MLFWQAVYIVYLTIPADKIDRWLAEKKIRIKKIRKQQIIYFSNFSCMFLNPNNFFQYEY